MLQLLLIASLVFILLWFKNKFWRAEKWPANALVPPPFQVHRGYWRQGAQENTLASFRAATTQGFKMIELDVRLSSDLVPVVFHDSQTGRFATLNRAVEACTAYELASLVHAPTLEEVLLSTDIPSLVNIEIKSQSVWNRQLEQAIAQVVKKCRAEGRVMFSSFNPLSIRRMSFLLPQVPRALLVTQEKDSENKIYLRKMWLAPYIRTHALHLDYRDINPRDVKRFADRKIPVALWTVNDKALAQKYLEAGALSIISDEITNL